jgi:hypothetical protein
VERRLDAMDRDQVEAMSIMSDRFNAILEESAVAECVSSLVNAVVQSDLGSAMMSMQEATEHCLAAACMKLNDDFEAKHSTQANLLTEMQQMMISIGNSMQARQIETSTLNERIESIVPELDTKFENFSNQFKTEMTWENHGTVWEIDHIIPCSFFDLTKEEEQQRCYHYTNLQPLFKTTKIAESFGYINEIGNRNKSNKQN